MKTVLLLSVSILAAGCAYAQEPPTQISVTSTPDGPEGAFEQNGDVDSYRFYLDVGVDYAVAVQPYPETGFSSWIVKNPSGGTVCTFDLTEGIGDGCEIRAKVHGNYTLVGTKSNPGGEPENFPSGYEAVVNPDCRAKTGTRCSIASGKTKSSILSYGGDADFWRMTNLSQGRQYKIAASGGNSLRTPFLTILDYQGKPLTPVEDDGTATFTYRGGTVYARVHASDDYGATSYGLNVRQN